MVLVNRSQIYDMYEMIWACVDPVQWLDMMFDLVFGVVIFRHTWSWIVQPRWMIFDSFQFSSFYCECRLLSELIHLTQDDHLGHFCCGLYSGITMHSCFICKSVSAQCLSLNLFLYIYHLSFFASALQPAWSLSDKMALCKKLNYLLNWITKTLFELNNCLNRILVNQFWMKYWIESIFAEVQTLNWRGQIWQTYYLILKCL